MTARGYGVDITPSGEVLAEAERLPDGTTRITVVFLDSPALQDLGEGDR